MKTWLRNLYEDRFFLFIPAFLCLCLAIALLYVIATYPRAVIEGVLMRWVPWGLRINFLFFLGGAYVCRHDAVRAFREATAEKENGGAVRNLGSLSAFFPSRKKAILLVVLVAAALLAVSAATVRTHRIYFDEDIYENIGQNIAHTGRTGMCNYGTFEYGEYYAHWLSYHKDPSGWPALISFAFQLLGTNELYAFFLNNLIFIASVLTVFFISWALTGGYFPAFLAALVFSLIPHNLIWHNTAAAEPSAALFAGLTVLCLVVYLRTGKSRHLFLLSTVIPLTCQMRPESALIVPWVVMAAMICLPSPNFPSREGKWKEVWMMGLLTAIFLLPHILHLYTVSGHSWGAEGPKFSTTFFWKNVCTNGLYYLNNRQFPVPFTALALVGLLFGRQYALRWRLMIFTWFLLFWGVFLFFYAGSYQYGADVRFALLSFMPLAVLTGMGGGAIRDGIRKRGYGMQDAGGLIIAVLIFAWVQFLPLIHREGQEAWGARYDHYYARKFIEKIPRRSIVLTHIPAMFLLWQQNAIQTYAGINNPDIISHLMERYQGHVYFHYNYWCNITADQNQKICQAIRDRYDLEEIASAREQSYHYGLYKMRFKD